MLAQGGIVIAFAALVVSSGGNGGRACGTVVARFRSGR
jgi:hypothetical protein